MFGMSATTHVNDRHCFEVSHAYETWRATNRAYRRVVLRRRLILATSAVFMSSAIVALGWLLLGAS